MKYHAICCNRGKDIGAGGTGGICPPFLTNFHVECPLSFGILPLFFTCEGACECMCSLFFNAPCIPDHCVYIII